MKPKPHSLRVRQNALDNLPDIMLFVAVVVMFALALLKGN